MLDAVAARDLCARVREPILSWTGKEPRSRWPSLPALLGEPLSTGYKYCSATQQQRGRFAGPLPGAATPSSISGQTAAAIPARDSRSAGAAQSLGCGHLEGAAAAKAARRGMARAVSTASEICCIRHGLSVHPTTDTAPRRTDPAAADARQVQPNSRSLVRSTPQSSWFRKPSRRPALRSLNDLGRWPARRYLLRCQRTVTKPDGDHVRPFCSGGRRFDPFGTDPRVDAHRQRASRLRPWRCTGWVANGWQCGGSSWGSVPSGSSPGHLGTERAA